MYFFHPGQLYPLIHHQSKQQVLVSNFAHMMSLARSRSYSLVYMTTLQHTITYRVNISTFQSTTRPLIVTIWDQLLNEHMKNNVNNPYRRGFSSSVHTVYAIGDLVARDFNANGRNNTKRYGDCCDQESVKLVPRTSHREKWDRNICECLKFCDKH